MSNPENSSSVLNRQKSINSNPGTSFQKMMKEVEKETINNTLATQFPEWDLKPPANLVRRKRTKL
ncbi:hypothetical protein [Planomicrobium sp. CPCC 101110]|uniref:hypothetical protein n=1 Tax=Planomicrobium sp. CPCC 101110 TaxID=2599619 RepID=UPI0011B74F83|nr:hypothetical protein [Planomicrobium sp. CPCC 101110]TWT27746.1 hypothetical protein FQV30_04330 [Planomicrobium sp. CPCC 101110]